MNDDSRRWEGFVARPDDIFISSPPKSGTTWTQGIVGSLLWPYGDAPAPAFDLAPWLDLVNNRRYKGMYYSPAGISSSVGTELTTSKIWQVSNNNSGFDSPVYQELATAATTETGQSSR